MHRPEDFVSSLPWVHLAPYTVHRTPCTDRRTWTAPYLCAPRTVHLAPTRGHGQLLISVHLARCTAHRTPCTDRRTWSAPYLGAPRTVHRAPYTLHRPEDLVSSLSRCTPHRTPCTDQRTWTASISVHLAPYTVHLAPRGGLGHLVFLGAPRAAQRAPYTLHLLEK